jgi:hypothetical protein
LLSMLLGRSRNVCATSIPELMVGRKWGEERVQKAFSTKPMKYH